MLGVPSAQIVAGTNGFTTFANKNAVAENAVKEAEKEILKYKRSEKTVSEEDLVVISKTLNERIRSRGLAAKEILTRRDVIANTPRNISDDELSKEQFDSRVEHNKKAQERRSGSDPGKEEESYHKGDIVYIKGNLSKNQPREQFIVTGFNQDMVVLQKLHSKFGGKLYTLFKYEIMHANAESEKLFEEIKETEKDRDEESAVSDDPDQQTDTVPTPVPEVQQKRSRGRPRKAQTSALSEKEEAGERPSRAAAKAARERLKQMSVNKIKQTRNRKWITVPLDEEEEEIQYAVITVPFYNYGFMDQDRWIPLDLDDWGRSESLEELDQIDGAGPEPPDEEEEFQRRARDLLENQPQLPDFEQYSDDDDREDDLLWRFDDAASREEQPAATGMSVQQQFQQLSRNPTAMSQVNTSRVVNLERIPVESQTLRRPSRERRVPSRFRDYLP